MISFFLLDSQLTSVCCCFQVGFLSFEPLNKLLFIYFYVFLNWSFLSSMKFSLPNSQFLAYLLLSSTGFSFFSFLCFLSLKWLFLWILISQLVFVVSFSSLGFVCFSFINELSSSQFFLPSDYHRSLNWVFFLLSSWVFFSFCFFRWGTNFCLLVSEKPIWGFCLCPLFFFGTDLFGIPASTAIGLSSLIVYIMRSLVIISSRCSGRS